MNAGAMANKAERVRAPSRESTGGGHADLRQQLTAMERWLEADRGRREVSLSLKTAMNRIVSEYSYHREEGLRQLLRLLRDLLGQGMGWGDPPVGLRPDGRAEEVSVAERVLRAVFPKAQPPAIIHPMCHSTPTERRLAMAALEGLAVLSRREQQAFLDARGVGTVHDELQRHVELIRPLRDPELRRAQSHEQVQQEARDSVPVLCSCLDTLLVACLDNSSAQHQVMDYDIPRTLCWMLESKEADIDLRYKVVEFLSVLLRIVDLEPTSTTDRPDVPSPAERLNGELQQRLGKEVVNRLLHCVTLRQSLNTSVPSSHPSRASNRPTTARERDLKHQADLFAHLGSQPPHSQG